MSKVRIGVFICHCGSNIGGVIRVPDVAAYARSLPLVHHAEDNLYTCSDAGLSSIREKVAEYGLNRVVVAACTPRTHEELFRRTCEEAGVNRYLFEFVNLREHSSWIHMNNPDAATEKAMELVRMGVRKAAHLEALDIARAPVKASCLVIGGGMAGLAAAGNLASQGFTVHLVERTDRLGGIAGRLWKLMPGDRPARAHVDALVEGVIGKKNVEVHLQHTVAAVSGFIGAFEIRLEKSGRAAREISVGTVIIATGGQELEPSDLYRLDELKGVLTQLQLERALLRGRKRFPGTVFINCAGARGPERTYCGRLCCAVSIKNARYLRDLDPRGRVTVLQRDVMAFGAEFETEYRKAQRAGVRFVRFDPEKPPEILGTDRVTGVRVVHHLTGEEIEIPASTVVLTTPLTAHPDAEALSRMFKVPLDKDGFFLEAHLKLRPVEFATDGVYVAGAARFPADIREAVSQGMAAAAKAAAPMRAGEVTVEATTAASDVRICSGCGNCVAVCPFGAVRIEAAEGGKRQSAVNAVMCKGCGSCVGACPNGAMQQKGFTDRQIFDMVETLAFDGVASFDGRAGGLD